MYFIKEADENTFGPNAQRLSDKDFLALTSKLGINPFYNCHGLSFANKSGWIDDIGTGYKDYELKNRESASHAILIDNDSGKAIHSVKRASDNLWLSKNGVNREQEATLQEIQAIKDYSNSSIVYIKIP